MRFRSCYCKVSLLLILVSFGICCQGKVRKKEKEVNCAFQSSFKDFASEAKATFSPLMQETRGLLRIEEKFTYDIVQDESTVKDEETHVDNTRELRKADNKSGSIDFISKTLQNSLRAKRDTGNQERRSHSFTDLKITETEDISGASSSNSATKWPEIDLHENSDVSRTWQGRNNVTFPRNASVADNIHKNISGEHGPEGFKTSTNCSDLQEKPPVFGDICLGNQSLWSCVGNCGHFSPSPCSCDLNCLLYNTCCQDFIDVCPGLAESSVQRMRKFPEIHAVCDRSKEIMLVSSCPAGSTPENRILCTESSRPFRNLFPVTDSTYLWHFKNVHCWRCWNISGVPLTWTIKITLDYEKRGNDDGYNLATYKRLILNQTSFITWLPPRSLDKALCVRNIVSKCAACDEIASGKDCPGFFSYVKIDDIVYKNPACYECSRTTWGNDRVNCTMPDANSFRFHNFQFDLTLNFDGANDDDPVEIVQNKVTRGSFTWDKLRCSPRTEVCSALSCTRNYLLDNAKCNEEERYIHIATQVCIPNLKLYPIQCQDTTIPLGELFFIKSSVLRKWFKTIVERALWLTNATKIMSGLGTMVRDTADSGMTMYVDVKASLEYSSISKSFSLFSRELRHHLRSILHNDLQDLGFYGPVVVCPFIGFGRSLGVSNQRTKLNCGVSLTCPLRRRHHFTEADTSSTAHTQACRINSCLPVMLIFFEMSRY